MFSFGGNVLAEDPRRFLPRSAILVYRRSNPEILRDWQSGTRPNFVDYVQVASVNNTRIAIWSLMILVDWHQDLSMEISGHSWLAFEDLPELFTGLAETMGRSRRKGDAVVDEVVEVLRRLGAVEQLS